MNNIKKFTLLSMITFIIWYVAIAFVRWESLWIEHIPNLSTGMRFTFFICLIIKIGLDVWLWRHIKENYIDEKKKDRAIMDIDDK
jgi:hypothetical protein